MLGVIFSGVATPVEAAGIGTFGAIVVAALHQRLSWTAVRDATVTTLKATAMVLWIVFGATMFVGFYIVNGGQEFVRDTLVGFGLGPYGILVVMMFILVVLGMFLDWVGILLLAVPIFVPLSKTLAFDGLFGLPGVAPAEVPLWFGVVYMVNMQMSFLSPPFGYALFYLKSVAPPEVTMGIIFRGAIPFLLLQALGLSDLHPVPGNRAVAAPAGVRKAASALAAGLEPAAVSIVDHGVRHAAIALAIGAGWCACPGVRSKTPAVQRPSSQ